MTAAVSSTSLTVPSAALLEISNQRGQRAISGAGYVMPIAEVGAEVGYASQSHFTKIFREATGMTPKAFRDAAVKTTPVRD